MFYYIGVHVASIMDKLSEAQRKNIEKMSEVRLVNVLSRAGYSAEDLEGMDRPAKMAAVAEITLAGAQFQPSAEAAGMPAFGYGYNPELERMKFEWMKQKWEFERAEREAEKLEREAERKRLEEKEAAEKLEREAERSRLAEKNN